MVRTHKSVWRHHTSLLLVFVLVSIAIFIFLERAALRDLFAGLSEPELPTEQGPRVATPTSTTILTTPGVQKTPVATPTPIYETNLGVPFSSQAPHGNWELPYQETCEEASAMLVDAFWTERTFTPETADAELLDVVQWQQETFGFYFHTTAEETARILRQYYGYNDVRVLYDIGIADIKRELAAGRPVIVPAAGRLLGNPNFRQPGPVYHMLVVKGFTADGQFITNDVGTRKGHNFLYDQEVLLNAIHDVPAGGDDWPTGVDPATYILTGRRAMVTVYPN